MAKQVVRTVIQIRRATTAEWEQYKDVRPAAGEPCFDIEQNTLKIGDGVKTYSELEVIGGKEDVSIAADGKSIVLSAGILKLAGFDTAEVGAQPRKNAEGMIEWVIPAMDAALETLKTTVGTLETNVENLDDKVTILRNDVNIIQEIVTPSGDGATPLLSRVEMLETKMDGTGEGSVDAKIDAKIEAFASNLTEDGKVNTLMELINYVESHGKEAADMASDIQSLHDLVGNTPVNDQIITLVNASEQKSSSIFEHVKYEISNKPYGTLVDYRDKEIRVMCPADTQWELQNVGAGGDGSKYYIGFKAYAPSDDVASFKEGLSKTVEETTLYFENNDTAGVDEHGRKYSIVWLPVAVHDADTASWTYYGASSSAAKYIGWHYSVEWYDADGKKVGSDCIRINLSNEDCHSAVEPYYMADVIKEVSVNGTVLDVVDGRVDISIAEQTLGVKGSDEIDVAEDGTLYIKSISFDKITQSEDSILVLDGGGAAL